MLQELWITRDSLRGADGKNPFSRFARGSYRGEKVGAGEAGKTAPFAPRKDRGLGLLGFSSNLS